MRRADCAREMNVSPVAAARYVGEPDAAGHAPAVHTHAALVFYLDADAELEQHGRFALGPGDAVLVPAGQAHRVRHRRRAHAWGIGLQPACLSGSTLAPLLEPFEATRAGACPVVRIWADRQERLSRLCADLSAATSGRQDALAALEQSSLLALVLTEVARACEPRHGKSGSSPIADALRFIERRCLEPISLDDVARAAKRSPAHLTASLKRATGKSVTEWITAGRLAEARSLLLRSDDKIDDIAAQVGYADATHFIRTFRRAHAQTPAAWRKARRR